MVFMKNQKKHCLKSTLSQWEFKKTSRHAQEYIKRYRLCMLHKYYEVHLGVLHDTDTNQGYIKKGWKLSYM